MKRFSLLVLLALSTLPAANAAPNKIKTWEKFDFRLQKIKPEQIKDFSELELKYLRGLVFARHGRVFGETVIQNYLKTLKWYKPDPKYRVEVLNATERANMDAIKEAEYHKHQTVQPGDLHYYQDQKIPAKKWGHYSLMQLRIMRGEIEARHGKTFPDETWLQGFFDERYWYHRDPKYSPAVLNEFEKANMAALDAMEKKQRGLRVSIGEMDQYRNKLIEPHMLQGVSLWELRILRNEIYARHGYKFGVAWLSQYFDEEPWYTPRDDFKESDITLIEDKNLKVIVAQEKKLHESLSTRLVSRPVIENLSQDDARKLRNELYARHGMVFRDEKLQDYFESLDWYQPNKNFRESSLNKTERRNAQVILAYEKELASVLSQTAA
jgi:hypothetical protein